MIVFCLKAVLTFLPLCQQQHMFGCQRLKFDTRPCIAITDFGNLKTKPSYVTAWHRNMRTAVN